MIHLKLSKEFVEKFRELFPDLPDKICKALDDGDYMTLNEFLTAVLNFPEWPKGTEDRYKRIHQLRDELHTFDFDPKKGHVERIVGYDQKGNPIWEKVDGEDDEDEDHDYIHGPRI